MKTSRWGINVNKLTHGSFNFPNAPTKPLLLMVVLPR